MPRIHVFFFNAVFFLLSDPSSVNLEKVSNVIVDQSLKDQLFSKEAGRICYTIVQVQALRFYIHLHTV